MITKQDVAQLKGKGLTVEVVEKQLQRFKTGFPFLRLFAAANTEKGIQSVNGESMQHFLQAWNKYREGSRKIVKFVPASGAASRMFKDLFAFLCATYDAPQSPFEKAFFLELKRFAFYEELDAACMRLYQRDIDTLLSHGDYKKVVTALLDNSGLNYGQRPKGTLAFHHYGNVARSPIEEHLVEGAMYASDKDNDVNVHFTTSPEYRGLFVKIVDDKTPELEHKYKVHFHVSYSEQKQSTDTIAANPDNTPFRNADGSMLFRPGGHGALIENLNDINADIIFIKNIDNVVHDRFKNDTVTYKQLLAGMLVCVQERIYSYLEKLDSGHYTMNELLEMLQFVQKTLCCKNPDTKLLEDTEMAIYLHRKLNRPIRVCGMVRNAGEAGGGPFLAFNSDGTYSPQILESSQINMTNEAYKDMFENGTHFNPVDIVCATKNYKGQPFDLRQFVDHNTGFISTKSKNGKELKALELPGLWNGAMSDWNTIFVEVPLSTFNPVKTVNDLLRPQHQEFSE